MKTLLATLTILLLCSSMIIRAEMQGAWISSVHNINFPSKQGLGVDEQKAQAIRLLDAAKGAGLNAVLLQVRPESDALYPSSLEPWSRVLTGTQGKSPGYDPLAFFIAETLSRVAMGVLATLHTIDGTTEMVAPALQRGEPDVKEDRQLRAMGSLSNSFIKGL
jgi:uncharacterized lipoprotein YddW (UPF0748 family)